MPTRHPTRLLTALTLLLAAPTAGQLGPPGAMRKAALGLVSDRPSYAAGDPVELAAVVTIDPAWHVNSRHPTFEYLIPTELEVEPPAGWPAAEVSYPAGTMQTFSFADQPLSVYEGTTVLQVALRVPDGATGDRATVRAVLRYQACDDRSCLPPTTAEATIELPLGVTGEPAAEVAPTPAVQAAPPAGPRLAWILLLGLLGGLILNAMPCVLPVLSIKLFGLLKSAGAGRSAVVTGGLATAAGIVASFWALAAAAVAARAAGATVGWGVQFQEPGFVAFLAVVVLLFCLNLWGLFEIPLPGRLARLGGAGGQDGIAGHFASGLFATLMATPCSAPFLGTAVGFGLGQPAATVFATFTAIGVGMALPYLLIAAYPASMRWLPRPGHWMVSLRVVMGFLLAGAAVWLLYVLAGQLSRERLAAVELALLVLALAVWARSTALRPGWKWVTGLAIAGAAAATLLLAAAPGRSATHAALAAVRPSGLISWRTFERGEAERLAAAGRLVFVDVTADWCFTCKVNERLVLETRAVADAFERFEVVAMKADWTNRDDAIARLLSDHGRYGIPFYLLYLPGGGTHLFGELLTQGEVVEVLRAAAWERDATTRPSL